MTWRRPCGYPAAQPRTGPPTTASGSVCSTACNATAPARCGSIRDAAIVRRDPAGNSARAWVFRKTIRLLSQPLIRSGPFGVRRRCVSSGRARREGVRGPLCRVCRCPAGTSRVAGSDRGGGSGRWRIRAACDRLARESARRARPPRTCGPSRPALQRSPGLRPGR